MADDDRVRGMGEAMSQAAKGLALFEKEGGAEVHINKDAAAAFKTDHEAAIKAKEDHANTLTGKDNKKERTAISKEVATMKTDPKYVDACKIAKDLPPPNGNFSTTTQKEQPKEEPNAEEPKADEKKADEKKADKDKKEKPKKAESAGISKDERAELEALKEKIIAKKTELKAAGKSGGECNKDPEVVTMVARMQELKIKEDPTLAAGGDKKKDDKKKLGSEKSADKSKFEAEIEEYRQKLVSEFGYTKKDIAADPDMLDMQKKLKSMK